MCLGATSLGQLSGGICIGHPLTFLWTCDDCSSQVVMIARRALFSLLAQRLNPGPLGRAHLVTPKRKGCPCQPSNLPVSLCFDTTSVQVHLLLLPTTASCCQEGFRLLMSLSHAP